MIDFVVNLSSLIMSNNESLLSTHMSTTLTWLSEIVVRLRFIPSIILGVFIINGRNPVAHPFLESRICLQLQNNGHLMAHTSHIKV